MSMMKVLGLTGIPSPESFLGVKPGDVVSLFFEDPESRSDVPMTPAQQLGIRCMSLVMGDGGISLAGSITEPPILEGRLAVADICWDTQPGYSGQVAISDISPVQ